MTLSNGAFTKNKKKKISIVKYVSSFVGIFSKQIQIKYKKCVVCMCVQTCSHND